MTDTDQEQNFDRPRRWYDAPFWRRAWRGSLVLMFVGMCVWGWLDVRHRGRMFANPFRHRTDFTVYTEAGSAFFDGRDPYEVCSVREWYYLYPPLFAILVSPLSRLATHDQVTVWFFISLLFVWGSYREGDRIVRVLRRRDSGLARRWWGRWFPWLGFLAAAAAFCPGIDSLQRGQVGVHKLYLLLLGLRIVVQYRSPWMVALGGAVLAVPIVIKVTPVLPAGFLLFVMFAGLLRRPGDAAAGRIVERAASARRFAGAAGGLAVGLVVCVMVIPAAAVGWEANLRHLDKWRRRALTKIDHCESVKYFGRAHSTRNQELNNAVYCLGNYIAYKRGEGPDDRLASELHRPEMPMDHPAAQPALLAARVVLLLGLFGTGYVMARAHRGGPPLRRGADAPVLTAEASQKGPARRPDGLTLAAAVGLACAAMLVVAPLSRRHYFLFLAPAVLFVPLWLDRRGLTRTAWALAVVPAVLVNVYYAAQGSLGRVGFLGFGMTAWLVAAMVLIVVGSRREWPAEKDAEIPET